MAKKEKFTFEQFKRAVEESSGFETVVARALGCHLNTVENYRKRHKEIDDLFTLEIEKKLDKAEYKLGESIDRGELPSIFFFLKCKGKHRGYVEKQEMAHSFTPVTKVNIEVAKEEYNEINENMNKTIDSSKKIENRE